MKLYKSFGTMEGNSTPAPYTTPIDMLPDAGVGIPVSKAIRQFSHQPPPMHQQPHPPMEYYSQMAQQPQMPQQYFTPPPTMQIQPPPPYMVPELMFTEEMMCKRIAEHLKGCSKCSRKYNVDTNQYIAIIITLVLFILFLLTKIIDKFS